MLSLFLLLKRDNCFELAGSTFSEQIFCLSFQEFSIGVAGLNPFVHDFPSARNIRFFVVNLHSGRYIQRQPVTSFIARVIALCPVPSGAKLGFDLALAKLKYIAHRQWLCVTLIGLIAFAGSASIGLIVSIREPKLHDEFSYLLAADTFVHGRLTNPSHPMWVHFESFHIIHQPTYMSKYPPGQGLALAAGQLIAGHPIVGVWLSFGLMCAAICWMLYAWVSPRWAIWGGVLALINPVLGIAGYWAQSYWGGAVAATGGALVLGGIRRLIQQPHVRDSLLTGVGLAILAHSRPFEGLLVSVPVGTFLLMRIGRQRGQELRVSIRKIALPILFILVLTIIGMGLYNLRVTGNFLRMPYQIHEQTYAMAPVFLWQKLPPEPEYRHQAIRDFHANYALPFYTSQRSIPGFLQEDVYPLLSLEFLALNIFLIPVIVAFPVLIPWTLRNRWARRGLLIYFVLILGLLTETFKWPHYLAPIMGLNYYFVLNAFRLTRWRNKRTGDFMLRLTLLLAVVALLVSLHGTIKKASSSLWTNQRVQLLQQLKQKDGKHLIVVSYGRRHSFHDEWVYNEADIDGARVVFARAINSRQDCQLAEYFKFHRLWLLEVDADDSMPELKPYPLSLCK